MSNGDARAIWAAVRIAAVMSALIVGAGWLLAPNARAQAASAPALVGCTPHEWWAPWGTGSPYYYAQTDRASGRFVWCYQPASGTTPAGWNLFVWQYQINGVPAPPSWSWTEAVQRVSVALAAASSATSASAPAAVAAASAIQAEFNAAAVPMTTDLQRFEFFRLKYAACKAMTTKPYPVQPIGGLGDFPAGWCEPFNPGAAPAPPAAVYVVTGIQAFPLNADGRRAITPIPQAPIKGSTCDCTVKATGTTLNYCKVSIPGVTVTVVASCSLKQQ